VRRLVLVAIAACSPLVAPLAADEPAVVDQVVRLLEADLSEEVILQWLEGVSTPVGALGADELVALKQAGASDALMKTLLERSAPAAGGATAAPSQPVGSAPAPIPPPAAPPASAAGSAPVTFHLSYLPQVEEAQFSSEQPWDLYVYIDGIPLTYLSIAELQNRAGTLEFVRSVAAGAHTLRVAQERHYRKGGRWHHETRAAGPSFRFELVPATAARLVVEFKERLMDFQDPLVFKLTQGETVLDSGRVGGQAESWPALCQDVEASVPAGKKPSRSQRQRLESCVEWTAWWAGTTVPPRHEVLDAMAEFDFRPLPKGS
jgi:hypothetical protein